MSLSVCWKNNCGLIMDHWKKDGNLEKAVRQIEKGEKDPYSIVRERLSLLVKNI